MDEHPTRGLLLCGHGAELDLLLERSSPVVVAEMTSGQLESHADHDVATHVESNRRRKGSD